MLAQCPLDMFPHQRRRIIPAALERGNGFSGVRRVAKCNGDVSQPALVTDATDRAALGFCQERVLAPSKQFGQTYVVQKMADRKIGFGGGFRELVPWTNKLTVVAAVDAVTDSTAKLLRNTAPQFDGQIRHATPRIEFIGGDDRAGRTDVDAGGAGATVLIDWFVCRQRNIRVNLAQKKPGTRFPVKQIGVFADPAKTCVTSKGFLENRGAIDENTMAEVTVVLGDTPRQLAKPSAQHLVIVAPQRVTRHKGFFAIIQDVPGICCVRQVVHARADHRNRPGNKLCRPRAALAVSGHVVHFSMAAEFKPSREVLFVSTQIDFGDPDGLETEGRSPFPDSGDQIFERGCHLLVLAGWCYGTGRWKV